MADINKDCNANILPPQNGISFVRYVLAVLLIMFHYFKLTAHEVYPWLGGGYRVKAFFILTGFLTFYSYCRHPGAAPYYRRRFRRIVPMYATAIMFCLAVGAALTSLPPGEFFTSVQTCKYAISNLLFLNFIEPQLPGVFTGHPIEAMNGALWSMKIDVGFYLCVPFLYLLFRRYPKDKVLAVLFLVTILYNEVFLYLADSTQSDLFAFVRRQLPGQLLYFVSGMLVYFYYPWFKGKMKWMFMPCLLLFVYGNSRDHMPQYVSAVAYAVCILTVCLHTRIFGVFNRIPNITYGLYLFHFPVLQTLIHFKVAEWSFWGGLAIGYAVTAILALAAHYLIEMRWR